MENNTGPSSPGKKELGGSKRRRSSTTSRLVAMMAGQGQGTVVRRHRGSSYQTGDEVPLVPDNYDPPQVASSKATGIQDKKEARGRCSRLCTRSNVKVAAVALVVILFAYMIMLFLVIYFNTEDPCMVEARNVLQVAKMNGADRDASKLPSDWKPELPKIIHQQWKNSHVSNPKYLEWQTRWKTLFPAPEYTHMLWTDETQRELIMEHFPWFLKDYDSYSFGIQRADAVRYFIMYHYGGVYADLDYEPLRNFWDHLPKDRVALIESPYLYNELVQNSLMSSPKSDPFWEHAFVVLQREHDKPVLSATGPVFLDTTVKTNPEPFFKLPCENFQRIPLGEHKESPYLTLLHREVLGRLFPMKQCGDYTDFTCQLGRHHNTASYLKDTGLLKLIWT